MHLNKVLMLVFLCITCPVNKNTTANNEIPIIVVVIIAYFKTFLTRALSFAPKLVAIIG